MLDYLIILGLGVAAGAFTGLVPGIHPNTVIFSVLPFYFSFKPDLILFMSFVSGLSVSHTFHDFLPAIFLSAPEAESALAALPGSQMVLNGRGLEAFDYTVYGGMYASLIFLALSSVFLTFLESFYSFIEGFMAHLLLFALLFLVFRSGNLLQATLLASLSGFLGLAAFSMPLNQNFVLLPVFTGLFAVPSAANLVLSSIEFPDQASSRVSDRSAARGGLIGVFSGIIAGTLPGIGAAVSTSFLAPLLSSRREFLAAMGGVNTSDILMSFLALYIIGKARSGSSVALAAITRPTFPRVGILLGLSMVAVALSIPLSLQLSRVFAEKIRGSFRKAVIPVLVVIICSNYFLLGLPGILVLATSSSIGYLALLSDQRSCCMAVLLVPAISFYSTGVFI